MYAAEGKSEELADLLDHSIVLISLGEYTLGSQAGHRFENTWRPIYLDAFQIDRYEVTNTQYLRFLMANIRRPHNISQGLTLQPVRQAGDWGELGRGGRLLHLGK